MCSSNTPHFFTLYITVFLFFSSLPLNTVSNFHERKSVEGPPAAQSPRWIINFSNMSYRWKNSTRLIIHTRDVSKGRSSKFRVKLVNTKHLWNINSQLLAAATIFLGSSVDVVKFHWTDREFLHFRRTSFVIIWKFSTYSGSLYIFIRRLNELYSMLHSIRDHVYIPFVANCSL